MSGYVQGIIITIGINLIAVLGIAILTGFTRLFSFGNAGFMSIGAYSSALLTLHFDVPFLLAIIIGASFAGLIAYLLGSLTLRLRGDYFLIVTLGFGESIRVLFAYIDPITGGARGLMSIPRHTTLVIVLISVVIAFVLAWNLIHSKIGRNFTAIREQEMAAEAVGIDSLKYKKLSFVISAIYAGWAGALYAHHLTFISPEMFALAKSAEMTITAVIGGLGSLTGSVLGTLMLQLIPEIFRGMSSYRMLIYGVAVVVVIVWKPNGLYGYREFSATKIFNSIKRLYRKTFKRRQG